MCRFFVLFTVKYVIFLQIFKKSCIFAHFLYTKYIGII